MGLQMTRKTDVTGWGKTKLAVLRLLNASYNAAWLDEIGFMSDRKNRSVQIPVGQQSARKDKIPITRTLIDRLAPTNGRLRRVLLLEHGRTGSITRRIATEVYVQTGDRELGRLLQFFYDTVKSSRLGEEEFTY